MNPILSYNNAKHLHHVIPLLSERSKNSIITKFDNIITKFFDQDFHLPFIFYYFSLLYYNYFNILLKKNLKLINTCNRNSTCCEKKTFNRLYKSKPYCSLLFFFNNSSVVLLAELVAGIVDGIRIIRLEFVVLPLNDDD